MLKERRFISWSVLLFAIVLILILMEHAQRVTIAEAYDKLEFGLNPYFNGTCSKSVCGLPGHMDME